MREKQQRITELEGDIKKINLAIDTLRDKRNDLREKQTLLKYEIRRETALHRVRERVETETRIARLVLGGKTFDEVAGIMGMMTASRVRQIFRRAINSVDCERYHDVRDVAPSTRRDTTDVIRSHASYWLTLFARRARHRGVE
jgi:hypothetical protein